MVTSKYCGAIAVENIWKRVYRNNFVFGVNIVNTSSSTVRFENLQLLYNHADNITFKAEYFIKNNANNKELFESNQFLHRFYVNKEELIKFNNMKSTGLILVIIKSPNFCHEIFYSVDCFVKLFGKSTPMFLTNMEFKQNDLQNEELLINNKRLIEGYEKEFLSIITMNEKLQFKISVRNSCKNIFANVFVQRLRKIRLNSHHQYFLFEKEKESSDTIVIEIENENNGLYVMKTYCEKVYDLLSYLYEKVPGLEIIYTNKPWLKPEVIEEKLEEINNKRLDLYDTLSIEYNCPNSNQMCFTNFLRGMAQIVKETGELEAKTFPTYH